MQNPLPSRHYANSRRGARTPRHRTNRKTFPVTAARFRDARHACLLNVEACADLLRVSDRTIRGWEAGTTRVPYAAYKLMRVLRGGRYLRHPQWDRFVVRGPVLVTPEGHELLAGDLGWLSLLVRRAKAFGHLVNEHRTAGRSVSDGGPAEAPSAASEHPPTHPRNGQPAKPVAGLVSFSIKDNKGEQILLGDHPIRSPHHPISHPGDTLLPATDALHGSGPGAVIPDQVPLQPLAPRRLLVGGAQ